MSSKPTDRLESRIREGLDESIEHLDGETLSRLNQARNHVLENARRSSRLQWLSYGGVFASVLVALLWWQAPSNGTQSPFPDEQLLMEANIEMMADLEMLVWLDEFGEEALLSNEATS